MEEATHLVLLSAREKDEDLPEPRRLDILAVTPKELSVLQDSLGHFSAAGQVSVVGLLRSSKQFCRVCPSLSFLPYTTQEPMTDVLAGVTHSTAYGFDAATLDVCWSSYLMEIQVCSSVYSAVGDTPEYRAKPEFICVLCY